MSISIYCPHDYFFLFLLILLIFLFLIPSHTVTPFMLVAVLSYLGWYWLKINKPTRVYRSKSTNPIQFECSTIKEWFWFWFNEFFKNFWNHCPNKVLNIIWKQQAGEYTPCRSSYCPSFMIVYSFIFLIWSWPLSRWFDF